MIEMEKVSIVTMTYNRADVLERTLEAMLELDYPNDYEIIVVDNGSTDGSVEMLEREFPQVRLIKNKENKGFAEGNNQAMEVADGDYFFLLNNDTLVTEGWLERAVEIMESDNRVASVGSTLLPPGSRLDGVEDRDWERDTVCGAAMLMKRKVVERIGALDADNFSPIYGEETDWNYRARNIGYRVIETTRSKVIHIGSVSTKKQNPNQYLLLNTHRLKAMLYNDSPRSFLRRLPGLGLIFVNSLREGTTLLLLRSYWNNLRGWRNICVERKKRKMIANKLREEQRKIGEEWF